MKPEPGIYVVMADNGVGEFLWFKEEDSPIPVCGSSVYSLMDRTDHDPIMSRELFLDFCRWAEDYIKNVPGSLEDGSFDMDAFNRRGMALARRLKAEWGDEFVVRYVRPLMIQPVEG
ncbi:MAG TPA: hypothetical protein ENI99_03985 [Sedimenticola sp.]|nr:hypothetical protein [Sedimenticola sp.]